MENFDKTSILENLNPQQKEAVEILKGPLLIVAGAGSGKTKVLTHRIANLIFSGVAPWNILSLTFTNKASQEMKERISTLVGENKTGNIYAGTFHSVFARILRIEAAHIGYNSSFSIYDTGDQESLVKRIMKGMGYLTTKSSHKKHIWSISRAKNDFISSQEFSKTAQTADEQTTASIYEEYEKELRLNNAMDFDDLLVNFIYLLRKNREILEKYQNRFKYILVDEYQDTNRAQYIAINMLSKSHSNLCVVGDDAQSIYKWRGADIRNILDFQKDFPHTKVIRLEQNYRSSKNILGAANSVIKNNKEQIPKELFTENPEGELVDIMRFSDDKQEAYNIAGIVKAEKKKNPEWKNFAILVRTNAQTRTLENAFREHTIPYQIIGGMSFYKRKEVKDIAAYLRLLLNTNDSEALIRAVNEPPRGLGATSFAHLRNFALANGMPLFQAFLDADKVPNLQKRAVKVAKEFADFILTYQQLMTEEKMSVVIQDYIEKTKIVDMYEEMGTYEAEDRVNNINNLLDDLNLFFTTNDNVSLSDYLQTIALSSDFEETDIHKDSVKIMTLHSVKGLEFPVVVVSGMATGLMPMERMGSETDVEEERRLAYVGMTRAMHKLYLTYSNKRFVFGEMRNQFASPFLKEIDEKFIRRNDKPKRPTNTTPIRRVKKKSSFFDDIPQEESYSQLPPEEQAKLEIGSRVFHSKFGTGEIMSINGRGQYAKATVDFDGYGKKTMMLNYAKLELVN